MGSEADTQGGLMTRAQFLQLLDRRVKNSKRHFQFPLTPENSCRSKVMVSALIVSPSMVLVAQGERGVAGNDGSSSQVTDCF